MTDEHRMWTRVDRLRRFDDPTQSDDPRVVAVLDQLNVIAGDHATVVAPAAFRAELRAQLVAITPRLVAEHAPVTSGTTVTSERATQRGVVAAVGDRPRPTPRPRTAPAERTVEPSRRSLRDALRSIPLGRPLAVVASLVTVLALVLGGSLYLSRDAVPGDTLYGLKRASERVELSFADTDTDRAAKYLEFASNRVSEARELVSRASASAAGRGPLADGAVSAQTAAYVADALNSADGDTQTASRLLGGAAVDQASPAPLTKLTEWAPQQLTRLRELRAVLPAGTPVSSAAAQSTSMLQAASGRATALQQRVHCNCLQNAPTDAYGPLPVPGAKTSAPSPRSTTAAPRTSGSDRTNPTTPRSQSNAPSTGGATNGLSTTPPQPSRSPLPSLNLPSRSKPTTSAPGYDLCKVNLLGLRICASTSN